MIFGFGEKSSMLDRAMAVTDTGPKKPMVGIVLAAGRGERFDASGNKNKLLASVDSMPTIALSISALTTVLDNVIVVIRDGKQREAIEAIALQFGATPVVCADAASGMGHSIAWGISKAQAQFDARGVVIALADMPYVASTTISALVSHIRSPHDIAVPRYKGEIGNPVAFGQAHFEALGRLNGDRGARGLIEKHTPLIVDVDDPGILQDIDTPADLMRHQNPQ